jgi:HlyD family secretion protein
MTSSRPRAKRRFNSRWLLILVPIVTVVGLLASGVIKAPGSPSNDTTTTKLETVNATRGTFRVSVTGPGTLEALQSLDVKPQVNGTVLTLPKEGQRVTKGELVAKLDPTTLQRTLENAQISLKKASAQLESQRISQSSNRASQQQQISSSQATYSNAQLELANAQTALINAQKLFAVGGNSRLDVQTAQSNLEKAQTNLESARIALNTNKNAVGLKAGSDSQDLSNLQLAVEQAQISLRNAQSDLANTKIYAPMNGVISSVTAQVGSSASNGAALFTMLDDSSVNLPVQVDETEIAKVKLGQSAELSLDAIPDQKFQGKVTKISPQAKISQNIAVFYVTVTVPNADLQLRPGMTAEAEVISLEVADALTLPKRAIQTVRNRSYVTVLDSKTKVQDTIRVRTGADDGTNIVIESGLEPQQTVVLPTRASAGSSGAAIGGGN